MIRHSAIVLAALVCATPAFGADANAGKSYFHQQCALCHSAQPGDNGGAQGPNLDGVVGRHAASDPQFGLSRFRKTMTGPMSLPTSRPSRMAPSRRLSTRDPHSRRLPRPARRRRVTLIGSETSQGESIELTSRLCRRRSTRARQPTSRKSSTSRRTPDSRSPRASKWRFSPATRKARARCALLQTATSS
jgi:hypothetical protein